MRYATHINMLFATYMLFTNVLKLRYHLVVVISYQYYMLHARSYMLHVDLRCK